LARCFVSSSVRRVSPAWRFVLMAWSQLQPHWDPDISQWTDSDILAFPVPNTATTVFPLGLLVAAFVVFNSSSGRLELVDRDAVFAQCPSHIRTYIWHAVRSLSTTNSFVAQLVRRLLASTFSSAPSPPPPPFAHPRLLAAGSSLSDLTTASARRFIDNRQGVDRALNWDARAISRLAYPPRDLWSRVWRAPSTPSNGKPSTRSCSTRCRSALARLIFLGWILKMFSVTRVPVTVRRFNTCSSTAPWLNKSGWILPRFSNFRTPRFRCQMCCSRGPPGPLLSWDARSGIDSRLVTPWQSTSCGLPRWRPPDVRFPHRAFRSRLNFGWHFAVIFALFVRLRVGRLVSATFLHTFLLDVLSIYLFSLAFSFFGFLPPFLLYLVARL